MAAAVAEVSAPGTAAPLLDPRVLQDMERDFPNSTVVERFAHDFCDTLGAKLDRLSTSVASGDVQAAQDAVLSLTSSAAMVGAQRLCQAARSAERQIAAADLEAAGRALPLLRACSAKTQQELERTYVTRR